MAAEDPTEEPRARVRRAARALARTREEATTHEAELANALNDAHQAGHSWSELANDADLGTPDAARHRAYRGRDDVEMPESAVGASEAARILSVSRQTIYDWIRSGRVQTLRSASGRTRVIITEELRSQHR